MKKGFRESHLKGGRSEFPSSFCFVLPSTSLWGIYSETGIHPYSIPFTLFHAPLHHYSFTKHFLSDNWSWSGSNSWHMLIINCIIICAYRTNNIQFEIWLGFTVLFYRFINPPPPPPTPRPLPCPSPPPQVNVAILYGIFLKLLELNSDCEVDLWSV